MMMKKTFLLLFVVLCMLMCMIPSAGLLFAPEAEPVGNEKLPEMPSLIEDGALNREFTSQLSDYFDTHFAYRKQAIDTDAKVMSGVFHSSTVDTVTVGADGWLYYTATMGDYLGDNLFTEREVADVIHNLSLIRDYTQSKGVQFLFTIAPNKNTLYPEHMPYYAAPVAVGERNRDLIGSALHDSDIDYVDLFSLFSENDEVLYFERDSHWNNRGALLAYDDILTRSGKAHDDYASAEVVRSKSFVGDLSKMLYPAGSEPEYDYDYGAESRYTYTTDTQSVEDSYIVTSNPDASGSLYMYRDSFGNALLPFFASAYHDATFTKAFPMILGFDLQNAKPDIFIMELVERNLDWLILRPPVIESPQLTYCQTEEADFDAQCSVSAAECEYSPAYAAFSAEIDTSALETDDILYLSVTDSEGEERIYECYGLRSENEGKTAFVAYAPAENYQNMTGLDMSVIIQRGMQFIELTPANVQ